MARIFPDVFVFTVNLVCSLIFLGCLTFVCVLLKGDYIVVQANSIRY